MRSTRRTNLLAVACLCVLGIVGCVRGQTATADHYELAFEHPHVVNDGRIKIGFEWNDGRVGRHWVTGVPLLMGAGLPRVRGDLSALKVTADGLTGEIRVNRISLETGEIACSLTPMTVNVTRQGSTLTGVWLSKFGKQDGDGTTNGEATGQRGEDGVWRVRLVSLATDRSGLDLSFRIDGDKITELSGGHPGWSSTPPILDATEVALDKSGRLRGELEVILLPDGWNPREYYPVRCRVALDLTLENGKATGTYKGVRGLPVTWSGKVTGRVLDHAAWVKANQIKTGGPDWPQWHGPYGDFNPGQYGVTLCDSLRDSRLVWRSEEETPGSRGSSGTKQRARAFLHGGGGSPVVSDGRVFLFHSRPASGQDGDNTAFVGRQTGLISDDEMLCIDAVTGLTLWKSIIKNAGAFMPTGKHSIGNLTPVVVKGVVAAVDTGGYFVGFDTATGKQLWRSPVQPLNYPFRHVPPAAAARAAVILTSGYKHTRDELVAYDAADGKELWRRLNTHRQGPAPLVWAADETDYVIAHNSTGQVTCLEARSGKLAWQFDGIVPTTSTLRLHGDRLLAPVVSARPEQAGDGERQCERLGCWQLSPSAAKPLWVSGVESVFSDEYMNLMPIATWRDRIYYRHDSSIHCLDIKTGRPIGSGPGGPDIHYRHTWPFDAGRCGIWEGRLVCASNYSHEKAFLHNDIYQSRKLIVIGLEPQIGFKEAVMLPNQRFNSYDYAAPTTPMVDGRLFVRGDDGVYCYDIRKSATKPTQPAP